MDDCSSPPTYQAYANTSPPGTVSLEVPIPWDHSQSIQYILPLDTARELKRELKHAINIAKGLKNHEDVDEDIVLTNPLDDELVKRIGEAIAEEKRRGGI